MLIGRLGRRREPWLLLLLCLVAGTHVAEGGGPNINSRLSLLTANTLVDTVISDLVIELGAFVYTQEQKTADQHAGLFKALPKSNGSSSNSLNGPSQGTAQGPFRLLCRPF